MRVLSITSECAPLVKTGGLADVAGALPGALAPLGVQMSTLLPGYPAVMEALRDARAVAQIPACFGGGAQLLAGRAAGLDLLVLDAPHLFNRGAGLYAGPDGADWPDNAQRFAALSWVGAELAAGHFGGQMGVPRFDLAHCHDWQAGLTPYYLKPSGVPSLITIHNIAFQGLAPLYQAASLRIAPHDLRPDKLEYWGQISALKAGLVYADRITTVSPTYARELMTPEFGMGLDGVLRDRQADVCGILNGIDAGVWSPDTDPHIRPYKRPQDKHINRTRLRQELGLPESPKEASGPLCVVVSRLSHQKGLDLLLDALPSLLERGGQLALLGSGDRGVEAAFRSIQNPNVAVRLGYDEALSHRMIAGGDAILVPSRFEPCGLTQLYGLRYGTLPLVALTGGLADTVIPATPATQARGVATGWQFYPLTAGALAHSLNALCDTFAQRDVWLQMQQNAMAQPVDWQPSATAYAQLYKSLCS